MEENKDLIGKEEYNEVLNSDLQTDNSLTNESEECQPTPEVSVDLIRNYPKSNKRVALYVDYYRVDSFLTDNCCVERKKLKLNIMLGIY